MWRRPKALPEKGVGEKIFRALWDGGGAEGKMVVEKVGVDSTTIEAKKGGSGGDRGTSATERDERACWGESKRASAGRGMGAWE